MVRSLVVALVALAGTVAFAQERPPTRTVILDGQPVTFEDRDGHAVVEGDILIGQTADLEAASAAEATGSKTSKRTALLGLNALGNPSLWPGGQMPYVIDPGLTNPQRVLSAIAYWNDRVPMKIIARTTENDYVRFRSLSGNCSSFVGRIGGAQNITLDDGCSTGNIIHELGHAFGLLHEQSRTDRNSFVTVLYDNIDTTYFSQYAQTRQSQDIGFYDYDSTMHYSPLGFSYNGKSTQATVPPGIPIGQRSGLSAHDLDAAWRIYGNIPTATTVTTVPEGLNVVVDGQIFVSPAVFQWAPGSEHRIGVAQDQSVSLSYRYRYVRWTDGGAAEHTFVANADRTVVAAQFQQRARLLTSPSLGGTITVEPGSADGYYVVGSQVKITAKPDAGKNFAGWSGASFSTQGYGSGSDVLNVELSSATTLFASFTDRPITLIDSTPPGRQVIVDGITYTAPARFAWAAGTEHTLSAIATQYSLTSSTRYPYLNWEDGTEQALRTVVAGTDNATYRIRFGEQHYLDFSRAGSSAVLSVQPPQTSVYIDAGTTVEMQVTPGATQSVQYWLGDGVGSGTSRQVVMDRPRRAVAVVGTPQPFRVVHAGSYSSNPWFEQTGSFVAPLELVTIFGQGVGPADFTGGVLDANGRLATQLAGTRVLFDNIPAPVLNTYSSQTSVFVPAEIAGKTAVLITVERNGQSIGSLLYAVAPTVPGLFTANSAGSGPVVGLNQDGSVHSKTRPAPAGSVVVLYATGAGLMDRPFANGEVVRGLSSPINGIAVRVGTEPAEVLYGGAAPGFAAGVIQINVRIPATMPPGEWPLRVVMGNAASPPGTTIFVQ